MSTSIKKSLHGFARIALVGLVLPSLSPSASAFIDAPIMQFGAGQLDDPRDVAVFSPCGNFPRERVGELPTELISHFFRSFVDGLGATLHIKVTGANGHHMMEATFKAVARALSSALDREAVKV